MVGHGNHSSQDPLVVEILPWCPSVTKINSLKTKLLSTTKVQNYLKSVNLKGNPTGKRDENRKALRLLSFELLDDDTITHRLVLPRLYRAKYYDYRNNYCFIIKGNLGKKSPTEIVVSNKQPLPNDDEFEQAIKILEKEHHLGHALQNQVLKPYRPMPPMFIQENDQGDIERTLCVGLLPSTNSGLRNNADSQHKHEIVAVNMINGSVTRFNNKAPANSVAEDSLCGWPDASQPTADRGTLGSARVNVRQGGTLLWDFVVTRPAASSGTNGSGIELQYVNYKGKRVLRRANVPILNVKYDNDACGPYRDWQYQESMIEAIGVDIAPGFRLCPTAAKTVLDTGNDNGNFLGVGVYVEGQEVVLVSEMEAGWYRYISQWRLHRNGTIKPRFGFGAVHNSCVCNLHHHHVYWRLNMDVNGATKNVVEEYNQPSISGSSNWHVLKYELKRARNPSLNRKWRIQNSQTGKGYMIVPGPNDGISDDFGKGDIWFLRNRGSQFDDGVEAIGPPYEAQIDGFVNHELIKNKDVVIWYGAHFTHNTRHDDTNGHIVGPDLIPLEL